MKRQTSGYSSRATAAALLCALAACTAGCRTGGITKDVIADPAERSEAYTEIEKLTEVILHVRKNYVDEVGYSNIVSGAIDGMLRSLDEHSGYLPPEPLAQLEEDTSGEFGGIGIWIGVKDKFLCVIAPIEDTPAFKAGMLSRDRIIEIDGEDTRDMTMQNAVKKLRGAPGTKVKVLIVREGLEEPKLYELTREEIKVPSVKGTAMLEPGIGYLRITQFSEPTATALQAALNTLSTQKLECLVIDLRGNPGGLLSSAVEVAQKFLRPGQLVVSTRGRMKDLNNKVYSQGRYHLTDVPIAVLINSGSASASEIVAGALQDHHRAVLVGETSFGKGSVQTILKLTSDERAAIRLTTAKYLTPSGREIQKGGIEPDIYVPVSMLDWQRIILRRSHIEYPGNFTESEKQEFADVTDPQLDAAVQALKAVRVFRSNAKAAEPQLPAFP